MLPLQNHPLCEMWCHIGVLTAHMPAKGCELSAQEKMLPLPCGLLPLLLCHGSQRLLPALLRLVNDFHPAAPAANMAILRVAELDCKLLRTKSLTWGHWTRTPETANINNGGRTTNSSSKQDTETLSANLSTPMWDEKGGWFLATAVMDPCQLQLGL